MKKLSPRFLALGLLGLLALISAGCADTVVKQAWTAPAVSSLQFKKVFVLAISPDDMNRRMAEVAVKAQITRIPAVGSYEFLPDVADIMKKKKVIQAVKDSGADGVVVLRMIYKDVSVTFSQASPMSMGYEYYYTDSSNADESTPFYQNSETIYANRIFGIETSVYGGTTGKLMWKGDTQTVKNAANVGDVPTLITEISKALKAKLEKEKLIP